MYRLFCVASLSLVLAAPGSARPQLPSRIVPYADLDLRTPAGLRTLQHRVKAAARSVCEVDWPGHPMIPLYSAACIADALRSAEPQVANVLLRFRSREQLAGHDQPDDARIALSR